MAIQASMTASRGEERFVCLNHVRGNLAELFEGEVFISGGFGLIAGESRRDDDDRLRT